MRENLPPFKVLIVDDVQLNLDLMKEILSPQGYLIATAKNGKSAIAKAKAHKFDLILLDIVLPDVDGFEVCSHLKSIPQTQDIPIVFLTTNNDRESLSRGFQLGASDYVSKPFSKEELVARVNLHLTLRIMQEELNRSKGMAEAGRQAKSSFLDNFAHEFRTPMNGIVGMVEMLKRTTLTDEQQEFLKIIETSGQNLLASINDILDLSKNEIGQINFENIRFIENTNVTGMSIGDPLKLNILLAEDNLIVQKVVVLNLKKMGHQVSVASDGVKAVEMIKNQAFDMIFMDIQMPEMDGVQATKAIREWEKGSRVKNPVPIVAMTASTEQKDKDGFIAAGMNDYLAKPFNNTELTHLLDRICRRLNRQ